MAALAYVTFAYADSVWLLLLCRFLQGAGGGTISVVSAYVYFFATMVLVAMRISPFSALLTALVSDERRGSLMSLTVALGQLGFAFGAALAGPLYAGIGYRSNTWLSAASVLIMGLIVWFFIPEPVPERLSETTP